jgi:phosphatidylglycerophosphatase C
VAEVRSVAAFDFDGTLTRRDSLVPFLLHSSGVRRTARAAVASSLEVTRALVLSRSRDRAKEALFARILRGRPVDELRAAGEAFADIIVPEKIKPAMWDRIDEHRRLGHEMVIVSASPEIYVEPIARRLGFAAAIATRLEVDADGVLTGRLLGPNCRGAEKVRRLQEWMGEEIASLTAYGDSSGDRELLALAGPGAVWVGRRRRRSSTARPSTAS